MGSSGKTRTTFAKLNRESKLRDKRAEKEARKAARKLDAAGANGNGGHTPAGPGTASFEADLGIPAATIDVGHHEGDGPSGAR